MALKGFMMRAKSKFFRLIVILFLSAIVSSCIYDHRWLPRLDSEEANAVKALKKMVKGGVYTGSEITDESERDSGNRMVKHVTYLTIRSRYMDDKAVFILANFKHLKYLTMVNSCVTYRGVEDLCDLLPDYSGFVIKNTRNRDLEEPNMKTPTNKLMKAQKQTRLKIKVYNYSYINWAVPKITFLGQSRSFHAVNSRSGRQRRL